MITEEELETIPPALHTAAVIASLHLKMSLTDFEEYCINVFNKALEEKSGELK